VVFETQEDQLEKLGRDLLGPGEIGDTHRLITIVVGEREQGLDGVLGFLREQSTSNTVRPRPACCIGSPWVSTRPPRGTRR
jgi:hypothetical protein